MTPPRKYRTLYERLVANTVLARPDDPSSCWIWVGHRRGRYGSLCVRVPGKPTPKTLAAHRTMLEEFHDIVFPYDEAGHLCFEPLCINPQHLEVQTQVFNLAERRGYKPPEGPMIPTLFPRWQWLDDLIEHALEHPHQPLPAGAPCPF